MSQLDAGSAITGKPPVATQTGTQISRRRILAVYKQMLVSLFIATLVVMGVLVAFVLPFFISYYVKGQVDARDPPLLLIVVLAGALGAFFSVLMRLYNFEDLPKALVSPDLDGLPAADRRVRPKSSERLRQVHCLGIHRRLRRAARARYVGEPQPVSAKGKLWQRRRVQCRRGAAEVGDVNDQAPRNFTGKFLAPVLAKADCKRKRWAISPRQLMPPISPQRAI